MKNMKEDAPPHMHKKGVMGFRGARKKICIARRNWESTEEVN
jgi:hypothetical protein